MLCCITARTAYHSCADHEFGLCITGSVPSHVTAAEMPSSYMLRNKLDFVENTLSELYFLYTHKNISCYKRYALCSSQRNFCWDCQCHQECILASKGQLLAVSSMLVQSGTKTLSQKLESLTNCGKSGKDRSECPQLVSFSLVIRF